MSSELDETPPTWDHLSTSQHFSAQVRDRVARDARAIGESWGINWRLTLRNSGINIQDKPSFHLAVSLARLATFEPDITKLLSTLPAFRDHQNEQAPVFTKRVDLLTPSLFGTVQQRVDFNSYRFFESWLDFLKNLALPSSVTTKRSRRATTRSATKRAAPALPANTSHRRCVRAPTQPVEVARSQEAALSDTSEIELHEDPATPESILDDTGYQLTFDEQLPASPTALSSSPQHETHPPAQSVMSKDVSHLLEDPLWRKVIEGLSQIRKQAADLENKVTEAGASLSQAKEELDAVLANIEDKLAIDTELTVEILEEAIEKIRADLGAEEALHKFLRDHSAEYHRLASASISASNNVDALDTANTDEAIDELSTKLTAYEEAKAAFEEANTAVGLAREAQKHGIQALAAGKKRQKTFQGIAEAMDKDFTMKVVDEALTKASES